MKEKEYMKISELVTRSGIPRSTIHFYLRKGLLHKPRKTGHTMAYYNESHLRRLKMIKKMKMDMRMPIDFIKERISEFEINEYDLSPVSDKSDKPLNPRDKRKMDIIRTAIQVFSQKGYHRTKVSDITSSLGISTGTFYIYFTNKKELFIHVIDDIFRSIVGEAAKAIKNEEDFEKRMKIRGRVFYENYSKYSEILNQLRAEMASDDQWPQEKIKKIYHGLTKPVIKEIQGAIDQGLIQNVDPDLAAYALTGIIEILTLRLTLDEKYTFDDIIGFITNLLSSSIPKKKE